MLMTDNFNFDNCKQKMNMKNIIIPMFALVGGIALTACEDELDIAQKGSMTTETFYKTDADCQKALAAAYEGFLLYTASRGNNDGPGIYTPAKVLANHPGDDVNYGGGNYGDHEFGGTVDEFRYRHTPEAIDFHYKFLYLSIYKQNLVIDYFSDASTEFQKQAVAEAKVLRAYNFFLLACYWGQPPLVDHLLDADAMPANSDMTQQEYFQWVADQCEGAVADLKERENTGDKKGTYRVTKGFALALAGKARMFAGEFDKAKTDLEKVIKSEKYDLVDGSEFANLFHKEGDGCPEKVFEVNFKYNPATDWWGGVGIHSTWMEANCFNWRAGNFVVNPANKYCGIDGWGSIGIPEWYGVAFAKNDNGADDYDPANPGYKSDRFKATLMHIDDAVYQTSGIEGMKYADDKLNNMTLDEKKASKEVGIKDLTDGLYGQSFYLPFKHILRASDCDDGGMHGDNGRLNNVIIMRYAEVLLNYAECCIRTGDAGTALTYINKIQTRAGSKTISTEATLDVLKKEKSFELWFEGCRFQDILRWSKLDNSAYDQECIAHLQKAGSAVPHLFDKLFRTPESGDRDIVWEHGTEANSRFYIVHTSEAKDKGFEVGFQDKHRLFPYPTTVMDQNPNIVQNPGW